MIGAITAGLFGGSSGGAAPTVTGGTLYTSGGFNYRVFTGNGTLGVTGGTLTCDVLRIAGGGSGTGGSYAGGGGGAGGLLYSASQSLSAANYTVVIGAGGAQPTLGAAGNDGTATTFTELSNAFSIVNIINILYKNLLLNSPKIKLKNKLFTR
jgi:hypothetical protein